MNAAAAVLEAQAQCRKDGGPLIAVSATNDRTGARFTRTLCPHDAEAFVRELRFNVGFSSIATERLV